MLPSKYFLMTSVSMVCSIIKGVAISAAFAAVARETLDALNEKNFERTKSLAVVFAGLGVGILGASVLQVGFYNYASERRIEAVRAKFFRALMTRKDVAWFDSIRNVEGLVAEANEHADALRRADEAFPTYVQNVSCFIGGVAIGLDFNWRIAWLMSAFAIGFIVFGGFMANLAGTNGGQTDPSGTAAGAVVRATIAQIKTVSALSLQHMRANEYDAVTKEDARAATNHGKRLGMGFGMFHLGLFASLAATFSYGSDLILESRTAAAMRRPPPLSLSETCAVNATVPAECSFGRTNFTFETNASVCMCRSCSCGCGVDPKDCTEGGDVMAVFFGMLIGCTAFGQSYPAITARARGRRATRFFENFISEKDDEERRPFWLAHKRTQDSKKYARIENDRRDLESGPEEATTQKGGHSDDEGVVLDRPKGKIEFINVTFFYPSRPEVRVLKSVSLVIKAGEKVALIGERGSGKSTIAALLEKFYCVETLGSSILFDGIDLNQIRTSQIRKLVGLVSQNSTMFDASIEENVRFGKPEATDGEVDRALKRANASEFVKAYGKRMNAAALSAGQIRRIALARALVRNPYVLILDEATADLDRESEKTVTDVVKKFDRTVIVTIASRASAAKHCTRLVVIEEGTIKEDGTPEALARIEGGKWRRMLDLAVDSVESGSTGARAPGESTKDAKDAEEGPVEDAEDAELDDFIVHDNPSSKAPLSSPSAPSVHKRWSIMRYVTLDAPLMGVGVIAAFVNGAAFPAFGYMLSHGISSLFLTNDSELREQSQMYSTAFIVTAFVTGATVLLEHWVFGYLSGRLTRRLRTDLFRHVLKMDYALFAEEKTLDTVINVDTACVKSYVLDRVQIFVACLSSAISGALVGFSGSNKMAAAALLSFPMVAGAVVIRMRLTSEPDDSAAKKTLAETVRGIRTVASLNMQSSVIKLYERRLAEARTDSRGFAVGLGLGLTELTQYMTYAVSFYYGSYLIAMGEINMTQLMQGLTGILMMAIGVGQAVALAPDLFKSAGSLERIEAVFAKRNSSGGKKYIPLEGTHFRGRITFESVSFVYPHSSDCALRNVSFAIEPFKTTAFVGDGASGKTTVAQLLLRLYDPTAGNVRMDDLDLRQYDLQWYRGRIGYVSREPVFFDCTIRFNISGGDFSEEDVVSALKAADAYDFVSKLPDGLESKNAPLSEEQKQRLAIARAVVRRPHLFIFDEAAAASDERTQDNVRETLNLISRNKTTVVITHRYSTIRHASLVVELCKGKITKTGTFEEVCLMP